MSCDYRFSSLGTTGKLEKKNKQTNKQTKKTDTIHRPTYSMARAIQATAWQKVSSVDATVCIVVCLTHKFGLCLLVMLTYIQW